MANERTKSKGAGRAALAIALVTMIGGFTECLQTEIELEKTRVELKRVRVVGQQSEEDKVERISELQDAVKTLAERIDDLEDDDAAQSTDIAEVTLRAALLERILMRDRDYANDLLEEVREKARSTRRKSPSRAEGAAEETASHPEEPVTESTANEEVKAPDTVEEVPKAIKDIAKAEEKERVQAEHAPAQKSIELAPPKQYTY